MWTQLDEISRKLTTRLTCYTQFVAEVVVLSSLSESHRLVTYVAFQSADTTSGKRKMTCNADCREMAIKLPACHIVTTWQSGKVLRFSLAQRSCQLIVSAQTAAVLR